jgi:ribose transport system ATP-binding protein
MSTNTPLSLAGTYKSFEGVHALEDVSLTMHAGAIHALVGENGAGKSTLIKILTGVYTPDAGWVAVDGKRVAFDGPQDAIRAGISAVPQERTLVPELSIAENILLHAPPRRYFALQYSKLYKQATPWLEMVGLSLNPRTPAKDLSPAQAQLVEVARALARKAHVLLLDEPTASITGHDATRLFELLRSLRDSGTAILFVSHKLHEIFALCDHMTVLRDGRNVVNGVSASDLSRGEIIKAMVGRDIVVTRHSRHANVTQGTPLLELRNVSTDYGHDGVSMHVPAGRIVGLYGLVGAGRTELAKALVGVIGLRSGQILVNGKPAHVRDPHDALHRYGIGYVSEDRKAEGVILEHAIVKNVGITIWDGLRNRFKAITPQAEAAAVSPVLGRVGVKLRGLDQAVAELSGGNQQKVSVAKWLASDVDVLIIDEPTIGVDIPTKEEMYKLIEEMAEAGKGLILISSDLEEMIRLADTILVMADKHIVLELENHGEYTDLSERIFEAIVHALERKYETAVSDRSTDQSIAQRNGHSDHPNATNVSS